MEYSNISTLQQQTYKSRIESNISINLSLIKHVYLCSPFKQSLHPPGIVKSCQMACHLHFSLCSNMFYNVTLSLKVMVNNDLFILRCVRLNFSAVVLVRVKVSAPYMRTRQNALAESFSRFTLLSSSVVWLYRVSLISWPRYTYFSTTSISDS